MTIARIITPSTSRSDALRILRQAFLNAGIDTPDLDARLLVCEFAGIDAVELITAPGVPLGPAAAALQLAALRRIAREPVSRILGWREFYGRRFEVTPATLDPRPDSETIIDAVLAHVRVSGGISRPWRIVDLGTGTGCLLLTLLAELPNATGVGVDISPEALAVARRNGDLLGLSARMSLKNADGLEPILAEFDLLVANPPYIPSGDIAQLGPEVRGYDPRLALDGGGDGLALYRRIADTIYRLVPEGYVCLEIGHDQAGAVCGLLAAAPGGGNWPASVVIRDLAGNSRCVTQTTRR